MPSQLASFDLLNSEEIEGSTVIEFCEIKYPINVNLRPAQVATSVAGNPGVLVTVTTRELNVTYCSKPNNILRNYQGLI